jgi:hypothetical protein
MPAQHPGGWVMVGHAKIAGDPIDSAVARSKTITYGRPNPDATQDMLREPTSSTSQTPRPLQAHPRSPSAIGPA